MNEKITTTISKDAYIIAKNMGLKWSNALEIGIYTIAKKENNEQFKTDTTRKIELLALELQKAQKRIWYLEEELKKKDPDLVKRLEALKTNSAFY